MITANDNEPIRYGPWPPTRVDAVRIGTKHFFTGTRCSHGHLAPRHTSNSTCMECTRLRVANWAKENPDKVEAQKVRALARQAADYALNPQKYAEKSRRSRARNLQTFRARERRYRLAHKDEQLARVRNRRARIRGNGGTHTAADIDAILKRQGHKCAECKTSVRRRENRDVDHIIPIKLGGSNDQSNLQILCGSCNKTKGAKHPIEFAKMQGRLL